MTKGSDEDSASAAPKKAVGLLDVVEAEASGEAWELDESDPFAGLGLGLGASPEARRLVVLGMLFEEKIALERKLAELKPKKGRPKAYNGIDMLRAAAVLGADDLWRESTGKGAPTQKAAIETAIQIDAILVRAGARDVSLFGGEMTTFARLQTSVSKGLSELGESGRFSKK